jgi:hypothetical protein
VRAALAAQGGRLQEALMLYQRCALGYRVLGDVDAETALRRRMDELSVEPPQRPAQSTLHHEDALDK